MDGTAYVDFMKIVLICILWYICSTSDNILGKVVLSDFPYPMTVTMTHLVTAALALGPIKSFMKVPRGQTIGHKYYYTMIIPLALGKFISSVSSYVSIWRVSVSYAHTVKATLPLFTVCLSRVILGEKQTWPVYFALVPIISGVCIATATELSFDRVGLCSSVFATFCFSMQTIFTKKCLKDTGYHHLELLTFITRISTALFVPVWMIFDLRRILYDQDFMESGNIIQTLVMLVCAGLFNTMHNVLAFSILAMVSSLSYAVANATKRIVIISGSLIILQNPVNSMNVVGMLVAIFGVLCYNKAKYDQYQESRRKEVLPYVRSSTDLRHYSAHLGIPHLSHSKSDADFHMNGLPSSANNLSNGHPLFQEWRGIDGFSLLPQSDRHILDEDKTRPPSSVTESSLHSRSVYHL